MRQNCEKSCSNRCLPWQRFYCLTLPLYFLCRSYHSNRYWPAPCSGHWPRSLVQCNASFQQLGQPRGVLSILRLRTFHVVFWKGQGHAKEAIADVGLRSGPYILNTWHTWCVSHCHQCDWTKKRPCDNYCLQWVFSNFGCVPLSLFGNNRREETDWGNVCARSRVSVVWQG